MILELRKLAIIEAGDETNIVVLTSINEGVDGSSVFGLSNEHDELVVDGGQTVLRSANPVLEIRTLKPSSADETLLNSWVSNQTEVYISAITIDGGILFGDDQGNTNTINIAASEQLDGTDVYRFLVTKRTTVGYDSNDVSQSGFYAGKNFLGLVKWGDNMSIGATAADNWFRNRFTLDSQTGGVVTLSNDDSGTPNFIQRSFYFPFPNETVTFSADWDTIANTGNYSNQMVIAERDSAASETTQTSAVTSTGRKSVSITTSSTCVKIVCKFQCTYNGSTPTNDSIAVKDAMAALNGVTTYSVY